MKFGETENRLAFVPTEARQADRGATGETVFAAIGRVFGASCVNRTHAVCTELFGSADEIRIDARSLSERARARATDIARDADLRVVAPRGFFGAEQSVRLTVPRKQGVREDGRLPIAGTVIERQFRGRKHFVEVAADGFRYEGRHYRSLSSVAREITGTRWNGLAFFGLTAAPKPKSGQKKERTHARS